MRYLRFLILGLFLMQTGCGVYSFSSSGKKPFNSVSIGQFQNNTIEYQLADRLTDAVIKAFIAEGTVAVKEASKAEAVMIGTVTEYKREPFTYDRQDNVSQFAAKVKVHVKTVKANTEEVIWEEDFVAQGVYEAASELEENGQSRAVDLLTRSILDRTTKSW
jgi:hypothetical protein